MEIIETLPACGLLRLQECVGQRRGLARSWQCHSLSPADWRDEMHLAVITDLLGKAVEPHLAINSNGDIWTQVTILEEAVLDSRESLLQVVDDGAYRPPGHTHL